MAESWRGGCQCGAVRYGLAAAEVLTLVCCHCRDCQRQSASAFGMSLILSRDSFTLTQGDPRTWQRSTARAQPWLALAPDLLHYAGEPDSDEPLYAAYRSAECAV